VCPLSAQALAVVAGETRTKAPEAVRAVDKHGEYPLPAGWREVDSEFLVEKRWVVPALWVVLHSLDYFLTVATIRVHRQSNAYDVGGKLRPSASRGTRAYTVLAHCVRCARYGRALLRAGVALRASALSSPLAANGPRRLSEAAGAARLVDLW
jgi:hypothetical protein